MHRTRLPSHSYTYGFMLNIIARDEATVQKYFWALLAACQDDCDLAPTTTC